jgi:DNA-binding MarR family transcriptional regulator
LIQQSSGADNAAVRFRDDGSPRRHGRGLPGVAEGVGMMIIRCRRLLWSVAAKHLDEVGESLHLYRLLSQLARNGPAPQRDLAEATAQHAAAISRMVDELQDAGLIRRRRGELDRRQIIVAITAAGRRRYEAARPVVDAAIEEVMAPLAGHQRQRLAQLLGTLLDAHGDTANDGVPPRSRSPGRAAPSVRNGRRTQPRDRPRAR